MSLSEEKRSKLDYAFSKTLRHLSLAAEARYNSEFAEALCAEASVAMYVMTDMQAFVADVDREAVISLVVPMIAGEYKGYFMDTYLDEEEFFDIISEHINLYSAAIKLEYTPPCIFSDHRRMPGDTLLSVILDLLGDYVFFPTLHGWVFNPEFPVSACDAWEHVRFYGFFCENVVPEIIDFANVLEEIFPAREQVEKLLTSDAAPKEVEKADSKSAQKGAIGKNKTSKIALAAIIFVGIIIIYSIAILICSFANPDNKSPIETPKPTVSVSSGDSTDESEISRYEDLKKKYGIVGDASGNNVIPERSSGSSKLTDSTQKFNPIPINNGDILVYTGYKCLCPFSVSVSGNDGYYIYLQYQYAPSSSYNSREYAGGYESDLAFYVAPNSTVEIDVPIGVYKLYYAYGETWYGRMALFGEDTVYCTSDDLLEFYSTYEYYNGVTLELWAQYNGNFETTIIDERNFP